MTDTQTNATQALAAMLERKYNQARKNGASDAQAIAAVRALWLEAICDGTAGHPAATCARCAVEAERQMLAAMADGARK